MNVKLWMSLALLGAAGRLGSLGHAGDAELRPSAELEQSRSDSRTEKLRAEFESKKRKVLVEAGHRHLELGIWCRDQGLVSQASMEFLRAVEVSEHQHPGAQRVLSVMRSLGDSFWKKRRRTTNNRLLEQYESRTAKATSKAEKERFDLAKWAYGKDLEEGKQEYMRLVELHDAPLEFDKKDRLVLPGGEVPAELSEEIRAAAITINGRLWLRDGFLSKLGDVSSIHEVENDELRVRSQVSLEQAQAILDCCTALLPLITEDTGGRPQKRMNLFVFGDKATYENYLEASGLLSHKNAAGLASSRSNVAIVNSTDRSLEFTTGIALHELSHLFMYGMTRTMMPSWYAEGFAETYGGQGCFEWQNDELQTRGVMSDFRLQDLKSGDGYIPLATLFTSDALTLLSTDQKRANSFYAESWAFVRFLRTGAGDDIGERFAMWEDMCRGKALGAVYDQPTEKGNAQDAQQLFDELFANEIDELELTFKSFLSEL